MAELVNTFCSSRCCKDFSAPDALAPASSLGCVINTSVVESTSSIKYCWTPFVLGHALYMMLSLCCNYGAALHAFADDQATASYLEGGNGGAGQVQQHMCRMHSKVMHFPICSPPSMQACVTIGTPPANAAQISAIVGRVTGCSCSTGMLQSWFERR